MLGYIPGNLFLYRTAFVHKSASVLMKNGELINNERLEFLGDAVLDAIVADFLFRKFPDRDEGFMSKLRSRIVKRKNLNLLAEKIGIPGMMISAVNRCNNSKCLYGNALEALLGAIYIDKGYRKVKRFFTRKMIRKHIDLLKLVEKDSDYKSRVIEWAQKNKIEIIFETKEEHNAVELIPEFIANITCNDMMLGTGRGGSKKEAEQYASKEALFSLQIL